MVWMDWGAKARSKAKIPHLNEFKCKDSFEFKRNLFSLERLIEIYEVIECTNHFKIVDLDD